MKSNILVSETETFERGMNMNTAMLKGYMALNKDTQTKLAEDMGMVQSAISARINGKTDFGSKEISFIRKRYSLSDKDTALIFFDEEVSETET